MKRYRYLVPLLASLLILFFSGCYSEATTSDGSVSLTVSSKGDIGDSGSGDYLVAKFYDADVMDELESNNVIYLKDSTFYSPQDTSVLPAPSMIYADYLAVEASSGSFTVPFLAPKKYRLLLEYYYYYYDEVEGKYLNIETAGISDAFTVNAGETTSVSVDLASNFLTYS